MELLKKREELVCDRLVLKTLSQESRDKMISIVKNSIVRKTYMIPLLETREAEDKLFSTLRNSTMSDVRIAFAVYYNDEVVGYLNDVGYENGVIEIGYFIDPDYHNKGFCTEALKGVIEELFRMGFHTVKAGFFEENTASRRVMEKCGMTETGETEDIEYLGQTHNCIYMAIENS